MTLYEGVFCYVILVWLPCNNNTCASKFIFYVKCYYCIAVMLFLHKHTNNKHTNYLLDVCHKLCYFCITSMCLMQCLILFICLLLVC